MKCPKCGYVSFEYLDECKKCGKSLEAFKSEHGFYGYPPKDLMVAEYLEEKVKAEEKATAEEISLDRKEADTVDDEAKKIAADLEKSAEPTTEEKETGEIKLILNEAEVEETEVPAPTPAPTEEKDSEDEMSLELENIDADLGIDDEITLEEPKPEKKDDKKKKRKKVLRTI